MGTAPRILGSQLIDETRLLDGGNHDAMGHVAAGGERLVMPCVRARRECFQLPAGPASQIEPKATKQAGTFLVRNVVGSTGDRTGQPVGALPRDLSD